MLIVQNTHWQSLSYRVLVEFRRANEAVKGRNLAGGRLKTDGSDWKTK